MPKFINVFHFVDSIIFLRQFFHNLLFNFRRKGKKHFLYWMPKRGAINFHGFTKSHSF